jgi:hypothetical protein
MKFHRTQFLPESSSLIGEDHVNIPVSVSDSVKSSYLPNQMSYSSAVLNWDVEAVLEKL